MPRGAGLERSTQLVDLLQVLEAQLGHEVAAARPVGHLALLLEDPQRLADGRDADPEPLGDVLLDDPLPGYEVARDDRAAQPLERVLRGRPRRRAAGVERHRNAWMPVSSWPITSAWTSAVPS